MFCMLQQNAFYLVLMCRLRQIELYIDMFCLYVPVPQKRVIHIDCLTVEVLAEKRYAYTLPYCGGLGEYSCTYRLIYCAGYGSIFVLRKERLGNALCAHRPLRYKYCWFSTVCFKT